MADRDGVIWNDGKMVPWHNATTHVLTHTLHYGMGVFEGMRAYQTTRGTAIFRLSEHTDRLFNSAHIFMMKIPYDKATLMQAQLEVVKQNKLNSCYIRPIIFYGSEDMGISAKKLSVHVAIAADGALLILGGTTWWRRQPDHDWWGAVVERWEPVWAGESSS